MRAIGLHVHRFCWRTNHRAQGTAANPRAEISPPVVQLSEVCFLILTVSCSGGAGGASASKDLVAAE